MEGVLLGHRNAADIPFGKQVEQAVLSAPDGQQDLIGIRKYHRLVCGRGLTPPRLFGFEVEEFLARAIELISRAVEFVAHSVSRGRYCHVLNRVD